MKNRLTFIACIVAVTAAVSYLTTLSDGSMNALWLVLFAIIDYAACALARKAAVGPGSISLAVAAGVLLTHLPLWIITVIAYDTAIGELPGIFLSGTPPLHHLIGTAIGYLVYKITHTAKKGTGTAA